MSLIAFWVIFQSVPNIGVLGVSRADTVVGVTAGLTAFRGYWGMFRRRGHGLSGPEVAQAQLLIIKAE
jgi:hypothetical protein